MSVSIVVPCYNVAPYVEECLESLVNQSLQDLEIICVNDGSTGRYPGASGCVGAEGWPHPRHSP